MCRYYVNDEKHDDRNLVHMMHFEIDDGIEYLYQSNQIVDFSTTGHSTFPDPLTAQLHRNERRNKFSWKNSRRKSRELDRRKTGGHSTNVVTATFGVIFVLLVTD